MLRTITAPQARLMRLAAAAMICGLATGTKAAPHWPGTGQDPIMRTAMKLGDWRLTIATSRFSGDIRCHLADPRHGIVYAANAVGFGFGPRRDTLGAWFRIDDGQAIRWQNELPELTRLGVPYQGAGLATPTDGIVWIPAAGLGENTRIAVQPSEDLRSRHYRLNGFTRLLAAARQYGCTPDTRFQR